MNKHNLVSARGAGTHARPLRGHVTRTQNVPAKRYDAERRNERNHETRNVD
jgi:hypothetical protein